MAVAGIPIYCIYCIYCLYPDLLENSLPVEHWGKAGSVDANATNILPEAKVGFGQAYICSSWG